MHTLDLIAEALTRTEWAELLKGPLELAARQGNRGLAQKLVSAGARIGSALHEAVWGGHGEVVNDLLENGASINFRSTTYDLAPLHLAVHAGNAEMVQLLMLKGADKDAPDVNGCTPLQTAARLGQVSAAQALLAGGADLHLRFGSLSMLVIHEAAEGAWVDILRATIEHGADVKAVDRLGRTALHVAASNHEGTEAIDVLVEAGANVEARATCGCTPLYFAASCFNLKALTALLKHGAHVNAQSVSLRTPVLHVAARAGRHGAAAAVDVLLRSGADETIVDEDGNAAADVVGGDVEEEDRVAEDVERVHKLLANAPADRAWRRRGYLVICRAHPDRVEQMPEMRSALTATGRMTRRSDILGRTEASRCQDVGGSAVEEGTRADWARVVGAVLGLQEEGIFRTIVGYL